MIKFRGPDRDQPPEYEALIDLPTRRLAIEGKLSGTKTLAGLKVAKSLKKCPCEELIQIGSEYVVVGHVQPQGGYDHHHYHSACFRELVLPEMTDLQAVDAEEASAPSMNKRRRRARNKSRKRAREQLDQ